MNPGGRADAKSQNETPAARAPLPNGAAAPPRRILPARTIVCSPHFDDAVLCCWAALDRDPDAGVLNVFTGAPQPGFTAWYDQKTGAPSSAVHMRTRAIEDAHALGIAHKVPLNLGFPEAQYRLPQTPLLHTVLRRIPPTRWLLPLPWVQSTLCTVRPPTPHELAEEIIRVAPQADTLWVPAGVGGHPDHLLCRGAGLVLASRGMVVKLYLDQPYAVKHGWPHWIGAPGAERTMDRSGALWARYLKALQFGDVLEEAKVVRLTQAERVRKSQAIDCYATQTRSLGSGRGQAWLRNKGGALGYEVFWDFPRGTPG